MRRLNPTLGFHLRRRYYLEQTSVSHVLTHKHLFDEVKFVLVDIWFIKAMGDIAIGRNLIKISRFV